MLTAPGTASLRQMTMANRAAHESRFLPWTRASAPCSKTLACWPASSDSSARHSATAYVVMVLGLGPVVVFGILCERQESTRTAMNHGAS